MSFVLSLVAVAAVALVAFAARSDNPDAFRELAKTLGALALVGALGLLVLYLARGL